MECNLHFRCHLVLDSTRSDGIAVALSLERVIDLVGDRERDADKYRVFAPGTYQTEEA